MAGLWEPGLSWIRQGWGVDAGTALPGSWLTSPPWTLPIPSVLRTHHHPSREGLLWPHAHPWPCQQWSRIVQSMVTCVCGSLPPFPHGSPSSELPSASSGASSGQNRSLLPLNPKVGGAFPSTSAGVRPLYLSKKFPPHKDSGKVAMGLRRAEEVWWPCFWGPHLPPTTCLSTGPRGGLTVPHLRLPWPFCQ